jgi:hypothetical protein
MLAARERAVAANEALQGAVDRARDAGHSWREIGEVLGTTRQAAFQRFGHPVDPRTGTPMSHDVPTDAADRAVALITGLVEGPSRPATASDPSASTGTARWRA